jgi:hypothetical protein
LHCLAAPTCLEAIVERLESDPDLDAASLASHHLRTDRLSRLGARWAETLEQTFSARDWRELILLGSVIRRSAYEEAGGHDPRFGLLSLPLLSARLHEAGRHVDKIPGAVVSHLFEESLREARGKWSEYTRDECDARNVLDEVFCERYFGHSELWANRRRFDPAIARRVCRTLALELGNAGRRDAPWLARELTAYLPAAFAGVAPTRLAASARRFVTELATARLPLPESWGWAGFQRCHSETVRIARLEWLRDHQCDAPAPLGPGAHTAEHLDHDTLLFAHGLERIGTRAFRWTEPVAMLHIAPGAVERPVVSIDTGGIREAPLDFVTAAYVDGRPLERAAIRQDGELLLIELPPCRADDRRPRELILHSRPLRLPVGSAERRRLGLPAFAVEVRAGEGSSALGAAPGTQLAASERPARGEHGHPLETVG